MDYECYNDCAGNSSEACGGMDRNSIYSYQVPDRTYVPTKSKPISFLNALLKIGLLVVFVKQKKIRRNTSAVSMTKMTKETWAVWAQTTTLKWRSIVARIIARKTAISTLVCKIGLFSMFPSILIFCVCSKIDFLYKFWKLEAWNAFAVTTMVDMVALIRKTARPTAPETRLKLVAANGETRSTKYKAQQKCLILRRLQKYDLMII